MARSAEPTKSSGFVLLASVFLVVAGLYFAREILIPIALAVLLTFLLTPIVRGLERQRLPRGVAVLISVLISVSVIGGVGYVVYHQLDSIVESLPKYEGELRQKFHRIAQHGVFIRKMRKEAEAVAGTAATQPGGAPAATQPAVSGEPPGPQWTAENPLPSRVVPQPAKTWEYIRDFAGSILSPMATAALVLVLVCFMLVSREDLRDRIIRLLGGSSRLNLTTQALDEASTRISSYLGALSIVNACYGALTALGLWIIGKFLGAGQGFPNVLVWGILVGVLRFVPYVGIWIAAGFPILLSFALFSGNSVLFATLGMFAVLEIIVSQFVEPNWYGSSTGMSPLAVLVSAVFWTWMWGPIGLLLSTPLTVIVVVMGKYIPQLKFIDILLREEPVLSPPLRLYQRLAALDQEEAADVAQDYLKEKGSLITTYDDLLIPALAMAEHDSHHARTTDEQVAFIRQSVREIAEELAEHFRELLVVEDAAAVQANTDEARKASGGLLAAASNVVAAASSVAAAVTGGRSSEEKADVAQARRMRHLPEGSVVTVLCLPARDEADEIVAYMLAQVLEIRRYLAVYPTAAMLASEMVDQVETSHADIVCISAMPPAAVAHARYLCKRVHARFSDISMIAGLWATKTDLSRAKDRIACSQSVRMVRSLREATEQIEELAHPKIAQSMASTRQAPAPAAPPALAPG